MVDSEAGARPQSGLTNADVVYEILAEGGITRFMPVFGSQDSDIVGPVRSLRWYFASLAVEHNARLIHVGGYADAYQMAMVLGINRMDDLQGTGVFWRVNRNQGAPWQNLYTSTARSRALGNDAGWGQLSTLLFREQPPLGDALRNDISIVYNFGYQVAYRYDAQTTSFPRFINGRPHLDQTTGEQYGPENVIVQLVDTWDLRGDPEKRVDMELTGSGDAYYFRDGVVVKGTWHKPSLAARTDFLDNESRPMAFRPGQTWIQLVPISGSVRY